MGERVKNITPFPNVFIYCIFVLISNDDVCEKTYFNEPCKVMKFALFLKNKGVLD